MKKIILITGTSSGLGMSLSIRLAQAGHIVYASMRNLKKASRVQAFVHAGDLSLNLIQLDVTCDESVHQAIAKIILEQGRIDCLINNAGSGYVNSLETTSIEAIKEILDINFLGVVRTTKAVMKPMRQAKRGQVINISSVGGLVGQPFNEIYCASKFAVEGFTESMASYIQPAFNIQFTAVEPGGIESEFVNNIVANHQLPGFDDIEDYGAMFSRYVQQAKHRMASEKEPAYQTCDEVADCVCAIVDSKNPPLRIRTSDWANAFCHLKTKGDPSGNASVKKVIQSMLPCKEVTS